MEAGLSGRADLLGALAAAAGADAVKTDSATLSLAAADLYAVGPAPLAVVRPTCPEAVARSVAAATSRGYAVVPRGGGLSYTGGYVCEPGSTVLIDLSGLDRVLEISEEDMLVVAEAGATWKQLFDALAPRGLRLPYFGTFSGAGATIGGGLSHGALFYGSARHGSAADIVLALEIATADGGFLRTGQWALRNPSRPVFRHFGPDIAGLFLHDGGAFGIKTRAVLRLIPAPAETGFASFAFDSLGAAARALSTVARAGLAEEAYVLDPATAAAALEPRSSARAAAAACAVVRSAGGPKDALRALKDLFAAGPSLVPAGSFTLHCVAAGNSRAAVAADLAAIDAFAVAGGGRPIPATMPRMARADPFPGLDAVLGHDGTRWVALNAKVAHSQGVALAEAQRCLVARHEPELAAHGVSVTYLLSALGNHNVSFEVVFHWTDAWLPIHAQAVSPSRLAGWRTPDASPEARALVALLRDETVRLFRDLGAASNQIGRTYPWLEALSPESAAMMRSLKALLDPQGRMNPGVLGLR